MLGGPVAETYLAAAPPRFQSKDANPKPTQEDKEAAVERPTLKLKYFNASWETVLNDIAEKTGSTLVADRVPKGTYSRSDRNDYSREEALRIINKEIEKLGFRVLEKGDYLVVLDLPAQRPRYERPTVPRAGTSRVEPVTETAAAPQRQFGPVQPATGQAPAKSSRPNPATKGGIQQASFETEEPDPSRSSAEELLLDEAAEDSQGTTLSAVAYRTRNQKAGSIAKHLFRTFRERSELLKVSRNGLPGFRVRSSTAVAGDDSIQFTFAIDEAKNELLVEGRTSEVDAMLKLMGMLDRPGLEREPIQLVSTTKTACELALQFDEQSSRIQRARAEIPAEPPDPFANVDQLAQADGAPPAEAPAAETPGDTKPEEPLPGQLGDVIGNLKGEVNIESVPDLGVLILKGNQADVDQVMQVIRELEKLSEQTAPQLELLFLQNVNSEALAELLTQVYESLTKFPGKATQPRQSVAILPVSKPNAILIVAPTADMPGIKSLADELDKPVDPTTEFQVFHLQSAVATQVEQLLTEFFEERKGLGPRVLIRADVRSNSVIVSARPNDLDEVQSLIRKIDSAEGMAANRMQVFPLKNAVATELAAVINLAIQSVLSPPSTQGASSVFGQGAGIGGAQVSEEFRDVRSSVLQFLTIDADGERVLRSDILADIRITPDPRMNALLVTAPEASVNLIAELIKALDQPTSQVAEIKVFTLANADASLMVQQLQALFNVSTTGQGGNRQQTGIQVAGAEDASSGLIPLRFSVDTRTNSVIAIGGADALGVVEAIMLRLDESDVRERKNTIYRLKNSPSDSIAQAITNFFTSQSDLAANDPNLFSTVEQLEREVIVVSEPVSNSLLISATPRYNDEIQRLIEKLDAAPQQVVIQALIVEVELNDADEFGIELGFQDSILFDRSIVDDILTTTTTTTQNNTTVTQTNIISQSSSPGYLFGNPATPLGNNTTPGSPTNRVGSQGLSNFSVGRTNGDLGFGGLVLSASSESVSFLLRALSENRQVRVLSRPQIRTLDNQQAQIQQGQNVPIVQGVTLTANGIANPNVARDDAGVILTVTPRISPDGNVVMALTAEKSQYNLNSGVPIFTDASTGNVVTSPVKDISTAVTTVSVPSGQTVVMGGLITSRTDEVHRKVPWLGDIPILGYAFRYDFLQTRRTELLIFLTPRIVWDDAEAEHIKDVEMARIHFIESEAEEMHGPLRGVPAEELYPTGLDPSYPQPMHGHPEGTILPSPVTSPAIPPTPPSNPTPIAPPPAAEANDAATQSVPGTSALPQALPAAAGEALPAEVVIPGPPAEEELDGTSSASGIQSADWRTSSYGGSSRTRSMIQQTVAEFEEPATPRGPGAPGKAQLQPVPPAVPPAQEKGAVKLGRKSWLPKR